MGVGAGSFYSPPPEAECDLLRIPGRLAAILGEEALGLELLGLGILDGVAQKEPVHIGSGIRVSISAKNSRARDGCGM